MLGQAQIWMQILKGFLFGVSFFFLQRQAGRDGSTCGSLPLEGWELARQGAPTTVTTDLEASFAVELSPVFLSFAQHLMGQQRVPALTFSTVSF